MKLSRLLLVAMAALVLAPVAHAGDTTPSQISTEQQKLYLLPDGTWVPKTMDVDSTGGDTAGTDGTAITQPTGGAGVRGWLSGIYKAVTGNLLVVGNAAGASTDSGAPVKVGCVYNSALPTYTNGLRTDCQTDTRGAFRMVLMNPDSTSAVTASGNSVDGITALSATSNLKVFSFDSVFNGTSWDRLKIANVASRTVSSAASTNATLGKASTATVYTISALNTTAAVVYLKLYNKATAPTVGTDVPVLTLAIPPSNGSWNITFPNGYYLATGLGYALTAAAADSDTTSVTAGAVVGLNIVYQ